MEQNWWWVVPPAVVVVGLLVAVALLRARRARGGERAATDVEIAAAAVGGAGGAVGAGAVAATRARDEAEPAPDPEDADAGAAGVGVPPADAGPDPAGRQPAEVSGTAGADAEESHPARRPQPEPAAEEATGGGATSGPDPAGQGTDERDDAGLESAEAAGEGRGPAAADEEPGRASSVFDIAAGGPPAGRTSGSAGSALAALDSGFMTPVTSFEQAAAVVAAAEARPGRYPGSLLPAADGAAPGAGHDIKAHEGSRRFYPPDSPFYVRTRADVWFRSAEEAREAGFTAWDAPR
jgi:hypothetical protein